MKKLVVKILSVIVVMAVCIGCGSGGYRMTMTVEGSGSFSFELRGSGIATVDWGDGSDRTTHELSGERGRTFSKVYAGSGRHTITITGNDIIGLTVGSSQLTGLDVRRNTKLMRLEVTQGQFTNLDVSRNTALTRLWIENTQLTSLDLSNNTALTSLMIRRTPLASLDVRNNTTLNWLNVNPNQLTASDLNALFESLPHRDGSERGRIFIGNNPGTSDANRSIAEARGWYVLENW